MDRAGYVPFCVIFTNFGAVLVINAMPVKQAEFFVSNSDPAKCPKPDRPEYAFIGRSNVGKSSLINMLTSRTSLAKISGKPGKTQLINHFVIDNDWYLVDLPGYGYAQVSKTDRDKFAALINGYLTGRPNLLCIFVLIDSRIEPQKLDLDFMENLADRGLPFVMVFTKTEKLGPTKLQANLESYRARLLETWEAVPQMFVTSAVTAVGREEILSFIRPLNEEYWQSEKAKKRY
jgi:GTP-binding protein